MDADAVWEATVAERGAIHAMLVGLTPDQWEAPSLCDGWRIRDVAAHVIANPQLDALATLGFVAAMWRGYNRAVLRDGIRRGSLPTATILEQYERFAAVRRRPFVTSAREPLIDALVHHQDMARPLGIRREIPVRAATMAIGRARSVALAMGAGALVGSVRMIATDADWAAGKGPELCGPVGELLMIACGRPPADGSLDGPGLAALRG